MVYIRPVAPVWECVLEYFELLSIEPYGNIFCVTDVPQYTPLYYYVGLTQACPNYDNYEAVDKI